MKVQVAVALVLVRSAREDARMTQRGLAAAVGLRQSNIAAIGAANVRVFGSVARGQDRHSSDVALLVDLEPSTVPCRLGVFAGESASASATIGASPRIRHTQPGRRPLLGHGHHRYACFEAKLREAKDL